MSADLTEISPSVAQAEAADYSTLTPEQAPVPTPSSLAETQTPVEPDAPRDEVERIEPDNTGPITLVNGQVVEVVPLKLRETMKLLKIVTRGAGSVLEGLMGDLDMEDPVAFAQTFGALILMSIPEAENEAVDFIQSMVLPAGFAAIEERDEKISQLNALAVELANPELEDVVSIVERVIRRESEDIRNLGKRISTAFQLTRRVTRDQPASK